MDWTRPGGYRSRSPRPPRPPLAAQRWLITEARTEELRAPHRAEGLMVEVADRIQALVREGRCEGFGSVVLDYDDHSLDLYWKGTLPEEMEGLLQELRRQVAIDVHEALHSSGELREEAHRIKGLEPPALRITSVGPIGDCSGLRVSVGVGNDLARARREIESRMRLEFDVQPPAQWIPAGHHQPRHRQARDVRRAQR